MTLGDPEGILSGGGGDHVLKLHIKNMMEEVCKGMIQDSQKSMLGFAETLVGSLNLAFSETKNADDLKELKQQLKATNESIQGFTEPNIKNFITGTCGEMVKTSETTSIAYMDGISKVLNASILSASTNASTTVQQALKSMNDQIQESEKRSKSYMDSVAEVLTTAIQGAAANTRASFQQIIDEKDKEIKSSAAKIESLENNVDGLWTALNVEKSNSNRNKAFKIRMDSLEKKMDKINEEEKELLKDLADALDSITTKVSGFSLLMGSFITVQTSKPNPEFWVIMILGAIMLVGTLFIIFMSVKDTIEADKKLGSLELRREALSLRFEELEMEIEGDQAGQSQSTQIADHQFLLDVQAFSDIKSRNKTPIQKASWYHWSLLVLFGLFALMIPVLLLIDTVFSEKKSSNMLLEAVGFLFAYKVLRRR
ncbi:uncharacterized protein LOC113354460 [Papaver somniferum]|nr:uncharacterized protein LOC113354460 [Papaver somniferum]XP_026453570.1 uncharacterized protein LOC113354460 [Papaver somniferum]